MAERRMFAKTIIDSDAFLDMPLTTQALYFHLSMRADDDGFINNPKKIQRMIGASWDDLKLLATKKFIIPFESGVVVIKHWRIHNYIQKDRYKETAYQEEKALLREKENHAYTLDDSVVIIPDSSVPDTVVIPDGYQMDTDWIQNGYKMETQDRLGKDRLGKDRLGNNKGVQKKVADLYNEICISFPRLVVLSDARVNAINARLKKFTLDDFKTLFEKAEASDFLKGGNARNWSATFDWLIKDANMAKVLDGNYDNKTGLGLQRPKNRVADELEESYAMIARWAEGGKEE